MPSIILDEFTGKGTPQQRHRWRNPNNRKGEYLKNSKAGRVRNTKHRHKDPINSWLSRIKNSAKKKDLEFNLEKSDIYIPKVCPVLGISLFKNSGKNKGSHNSPSIDRFDNTKGYTKDNIRIISLRANSLKSDATADEIRKVLMYMENSSI